MAIDQSICRTRIHDLRTIQNDLRILVRLLQSGEPIDPLELPGVVLQIQNGVKILEKEIEALSKFLAQT